MFRTISSSELREMWRERREVAVFDAREESNYAVEHPFFAVSLPLSRIETDIFRLVPRRATPVVFYDAGEGLALRAARAAAQLDYSDVRLLDGGLAAYAQTGEVFRDVNVVSKAFGELVEAICHTPSLSAEEVQRRIASGADMVVLDVRRFEEYQTMCLPGALSVPGGELALRIRDLTASQQTLVLVNCAGRTRSIIGTQSLIHSGISNPVAALRNGTIGWTLAGFTLDQGGRQRCGPVSGASRAAARATAVDFANRAGVIELSSTGWRRWQQESEDRTLYCFDVRTPEEHVAGHPAGFVSAPGGQLVQATDEWVAARGARIALFDDDGVRARMTASWLAQMGWEVGVVEEGLLQSNQSGAQELVRPPRPDVRAVTADELSSGLAGVTMVDLAPSPQYKKGHIPGAWFMIRSRIVEDFAGLPNGPVVLTSPDGTLAAFAAEEFSLASSFPVRVLSGGTQAWEKSGYQLESLAARYASPPKDIYKRPYEGTDNATEAMRGYIEWELQLVAQLANDGVSNFRVVR